jgi:hypothetical protein
MARLVQIARHLIAPAPVSAVSTDTEVTTGVLQARVPIDEVGTALYEKVSHQRVTSLADLLACVV